MSDHQFQLPDNLEIIRYKRKIAQLLHHHQYRYKYVGEEGAEYEVIQSVFSEINRLPELSNRHIRWYAIIIHLVEHFYRQRMRRRNQGGILDLSLLAVTEDFQVSLWESAGDGDFKFTARVEKDNSPEFSIPPFIGALEPLVREIAALGMLACTKEAIDQVYLEYGARRIHSYFTALLKDMKSQLTGQNREEVFHLALHHATQNAIKLEQILIDPGETNTARFTPGSEYRDLIRKRLQCIDEERLAGYYNMHDFWNGFIP